MHGKKRLSMILFAGLLILLSGCASTIRSNVTVFSEWSAELPDRSYVFERSQAQDNNLEYLNYENLVRNEVRRLGFNEAETGQKPSLKMTLDFSVQAVDVRVVQPVYADPFLYGPGFYGRGFYSRRHFGAGVDPFYWGPPMVAYQDQTYQLNRRQLHLTISRYADGKNLYDVKVQSQGDNPSLAVVMPYLVHSAFVGFPGKSGVSRTVDLKMTD